MASPNCLVNGTATTNGVNVAKNSAVTIQLADIAGAKTWLIQCLSTDDHQVAATITASLSINSITKTATFTSPNVTDGAALVFESKVNGGLDANGRVDASLTTRFGIFVLTDAGSLRVGAFDETLEGNASFGWTAKFNAGIRAAGTAGMTPTVSGTLPITIDSSNPLALVVGVNAATTSLPGSMSAADKTKLDASNAIATASTLAMYDASGNLTAEAFKLKTAVTGVVRSLPLNWTSQWVGTDPGWVATPTGTAKQNVVDSLAELYIQMNLPHGCVVTNMYVKTKGDGAGPVPGNLPGYYFIRQHMGTLSQTIIGINVDAGGATYRSTSHYTTVACAGPTSNIIDRATYRYYCMVTPETGSDAVVGLQLDSLSVELTFPTGFSILLGLG